MMNMHTEKNILVVALLLLALAAFSAPAVNADPTITIEVVPSTDQVMLGDQFYVNITISNIEETHDLVGIEFKLTWNTTLLIGIEMVLPPGHIFQAAEDDGNLWVIKKTVDNEAGEAWYMVTVNNLQQGYDNGYMPLTGSGVICQIFFNASNNIEGTSPLTFMELPPTNLKVKLSNGEGSPITDFEVVESSIEVVPEFANLLLTMLLLMASVISIIGYKKLPKRCCK